MNVLKYIQLCNADKKKCQRQHNGFLFFLYCITKSNFCPSFYSLFLEILCYKLGINPLKWTEDQPNIPYVQTSKMYAFVFPHKISIWLSFDIVNIDIYIYILRKFLSHNLISVVLE